MRAHTLSPTCKALTLLAALALAPLLRAQDPPVDEPDEWDAKLAFRRDAGRDLVALRHRRGGHGLAEVGAREHGPIAALPRAGARWNTVGAALLLLAPVDAGVLDAVATGHHLRRAGIDPDPIALRQFLLTPCAADDAVRARVEQLDRAVALLHLRHTG